MSAVGAVQSCRVERAPFVLPPRDFYQPGDKVTKGQSLRQIEASFYGTSACGVLIALRFILDLKFIWSSSSLHQNEDESNHQSSRICQYDSYYLTTGGNRQDTWRHESYKFKTDMLGSFDSDSLLI